MPPILQRKLNSTHTPAFFLDSSKTQDIKNWIASGLKRFDLRLAVAGHQKRKQAHTVEFKPTAPSNTRRAKELRAPEKAYGAVQDLLKGLDHATFVQRLPGGQRHLITIKNDAHVLAKADALLISVDGIHFSPLLEQEAVQLMTTYDPIAAPPLYQEKQDGEYCGKHAANAFFGKEVLSKQKYDEFISQLRPRNPDIEAESASRRAMLGDEEMLPLLRAHAPAGMRIENKELLCGAGADSAQKHADLEALAHLESNPQVTRLMVLDPHRKHHIAFRRDEDGQWVMIDSIRKGQPKQRLSEYIRMQEDSHTNTDLFYSYSWSICMDSLEPARTQV